MTSDQWTTDEKVLFIRPEESLFLPGADAQPGMVQCVVYGTVPDGRRFYMATLVREELLAEIGEDRYAEMLRAEARPPADP